LAQYRKIAEFNLALGCLAQYRKTADFNVTLSYLAQYRKTPTIALEHLEPCRKMAVETRQVEFMIPDNVEASL